MRFLLLFPLLTLSFTRAICQAEDSISISSAKQLAILFYEKKMEGIDLLYNGSEYIAYKPLADEHPYFLTSEWTYSKVKYNGEWFQHVPILFDIEKELLVTSYYYNGNKMQMQPDRVNEFLLDGHQFINIDQSDTSGNRHGYYEILYSGHTQLVSRRIKKLKEQIDGLEVSRNFIESSQYFLIHRGELVSVSSKHDLLKTLEDHKKELKTYIRNQRLFTGNRELSLVTVAKYYDSLLQ